MAWMPKKRSSIPGMFYLFSEAHKAALGPTQPRIRQVTEAVSPLVKWPRYPDDHSPLPISEFKKE
jgi:hypothetical protein